MQDWPLNNPWDYPPHHRRIRGESLEVLTSTAIMSISPFSFKLNISP